MDWFKPIDGYCERIDPSFWAEPVNAITNLAFIIAGWFACKQVKKTSSETRYLWLLPILMMAIGIGSFLFHTFANLWSLLADVIPIYIFQLVFLYQYSRKVLLWSMLSTLGLFVIYFALTFLIPKLDIPLHGGQMYLSTLLLLMVLPFLKRPMVKYLLIASVVFALSLTFRTIDQWSCHYWSWGTHGFWHCLNAVVLWICWYVIYLNTRHKI
ncbi:MAG: ceramidase domain-containing protein [Pseudomonadota bacterium]